MAFSFTCSSHQVNPPILLALDSTGSKYKWHEPGYTVTSDDGREFMFTEFTSGTAVTNAVAGAPAAFILDAAGTVVPKVTPDLSDGYQANCAAFLSAVASGTEATWYCWVQTKGHLIDAPSSDEAGANVAAKDPLYAANDGRWSKATLGSHHILGVALEAGTAGFGDVQLIDK